MIKNGQKYIYTCDYLSIVELIEVFEIRHNVCFARMLDIYDNEQPYSDQQIGQNFKFALDYEYIRGLIKTDCETMDEIKIVYPELFLWNYVLIVFICVVQKTI